MRRLEDMTPQRGGQRLNDFVAELLSYWGVDRLQANVRGAGEVDVAFVVDSYCRISQCLPGCPWLRRPCRASKIEGFRY